MHPVSIGWQEMLEDGAAGPQLKYDITIKQGFEYGSVIICFWPGFILFEACKNESADKLKFGGLFFL